MKCLSCPQYAVWLIAGLAPLDEYEHCCRGTVGVSECMWYCLAYLHSASVYICALFLEWHCNISWYFCTCCCRLWRNCCWCWICNVLVSDLVFDLNCIYSAYVCWRCWWDFGFSLTGKLENLAEYPSKVGRIFFSVEEKWLVPSTFHTVRIFRPDHCLLVTYILAIKTQRIVMHTLCSSVRNKWQCKKSWLKVA